MHATSPPTRAYDRHAITLADLICMVVDEGLAPSQVGIYVEHDGDALPVNVAVVDDEGDIELRHLRSGPVPSPDDTP